MTRAGSATAAKPLNYEESSVIVVVPLVAYRLYSKQNRLKNHGKILTTLGRAKKVTASCQLVHQSHMKIRVSEKRAKGLVVPFPVQLRSEVRCGIPPKQQCASAEFPVLDTRFSSRTRISRTTCNQFDLPGSVIRSEQENMRMGH